MKYLKSLILFLLPIVAVKVATEFFYHKHTVEFSENLLMASIGFGVASAFSYLIYKTGEK